MRSVVVSVALAVTARTVGVLSLLAVTLVTAGVPATAHARLSSSTPAAGARVAALPKTVELRFTEVVGTPASVSVTGPGGEHATGPAEVTDDVLTQRLAVEGAQPGSHTIAYQVTSADGHTISGTVRFVVASAGGPIGSAGGAATGGGGPAVTPAVGTGVVVGLAGCLALSLALALMSLRRVVHHVPRA